MGIWQLPNASGHFEAVHAGHANIKQNHRGTVIVDGVQSRGAIMHNDDIPAQVFQQHSESFCRVDVIVDDQDGFRDGKTLTRRGWRNEP